MSKKRKIGIVDSLLLSVGCQVKYFLLIAFPYIAINISKHLNKGYNSELDFDRAFFPGDDD